MAYNEKELEQMISVIKNLKKERNEAKNEGKMGQKTNVNTSSTTYSKSAINNVNDDNHIEIRKGGDYSKDHSFYSRIFNSDKSSNVAGEMHTGKTTNINENIVDRSLLEDTVKEIVLAKIEDQDFMKQIITTIIKEYNSQEIQQHIMEEVQQQVEAAISDQVNKMVKNVIHQMGELLLKV